MGYPLLPSNDVFLFWCFNEKCHNDVSAKKHQECFGACRSVVARRFVCPDIIWKSKYFHKLKANTLFVNQMGCHITSVNAVYKFRNNKNVFKAGYIYYRDNIKTLKHLKQQSELPMNQLPRTPYYSLNQGETSLLKSAGWFVVRMSSLDKTKLMKKSWPSG